MRLPKGGIQIRKLLKPKIFRKHSGRYIFTDKRHPWEGGLSVLLGVLSIISIVLAVQGTYRLGGAVDGRYAVAVILSLLYAIAGLVMGIYARTRKDIFLLFPVLGIIINVAAMLAVAGILYLGLT